MSETNLWRPRLNCAAAQSRGQFCVALTELEYDDPFSALIRYDDRFPQPWSRTDVQREICAVCTTPTIDGNHPGYAALSNEGDVYLLGASTRSEKIAGSGVLSPDANGLGAMFEIGWIEGQLWASGDNAQLYVREYPDTWRRIYGPTPQKSSDRTSLGKLVDVDGNIYIIGVDWPLNDVKHSREEQLLSNDNWDAWLSEKSTAPDHPLPTGRLFISNRGDLGAIPLPTKSILVDIFPASGTEIWVVGYDGTILVGNHIDGFRNVAFDGDRKRNLVSVTKFEGTVVVASDYALHRFDGHLLSPLKPKLDPFINKNVPTPLKVQAIDDVMFYFDYKHGVHRWDGENWEEIVIPPELLKRDFKGLPQRG